jgi:hypothetical protein
MLRYLKAALFVRPHIPGLGRVPVNLLAMACMAILGFGHPAFWLLGLGLETAFLAMLSTNTRFQRLVDAQDQARGQIDAEATRHALVAQLNPAARAGLDRLEAKCERAISLSRLQGMDEYLINNNRDALKQLSWLYLKLLIGQQYLLSPESQSTESNLREEIAAIQQELSREKIAPSLRESRSEMLRILQRRLENLERRQHRLKEIDSDLRRIEAQVELAIENATIGSEPQGLALNITLASQLLDPDLLGQSGRMIADLDQTYGHPASLRQPT